eukprot:SAG31_NODE_2553_length_5503_cov_24.613064_1_plen_419_part_00
MEWRSLTEAWSPELHHLFDPEHRSRAWELLLVLSLLKELPIDVVLRIISQAIPPTKIRPPFVPKGLCTSNLRLCCYSNLRLCCAPRGAVVVSAEVRHMAPTLADAAEIHQRQGSIQNAWYRPGFGWASLPPFKQITGAVDCMACLLEEDHVIVAIGHSQEPATAQLRYWEPTEQQQHAAAAVAHSPRVCYTVETLDLRCIRQGWRHMTDLGACPVLPSPSFRELPTLHCAASGRLFAVGRGTGTAAMLDLKLGRVWVELPPMLDPVYQPAVCSTHDGLKLVVAGGAYKNIGRHASSAAVLDLGSWDSGASSPSWAALPDMSSKRLGLGLCCTAKGQVVAAGGKVSRHMRRDKDRLYNLNSVEMFDLADPDSEWIPMPPMTETRADVAIACTPNGSIVAVDRFASGSIEKIQLPDQAEG